MTSFFSPRDTSEFGDDAKAVLLWGWWCRPPPGFDLGSPSAWFALGSSVPGLWRVLSPHSLDVSRQEHVFCAAALWNHSSGRKRPWTCTNNCVFKMWGFMMLPRELPSQAHSLSPAPVPVPTGISHCSFRCAWPCPQPERPLEGRDPVSSLCVTRRTWTV